MGSGYGRHDKGFEYSSNVGVTTMIGHFLDRDELKEAVKYAHIRGVQVFVTTNTLRKENEIADFLEYAKFLYDIDVDAIILQDIGMARLIKRELPDFELHASTQMVAHSLEDVKYLEGVGFDRVVLAREVTVEDIIDIYESAY